MFERIGARVLFAGVVRFEGGSATVVRAERLELLGSYSWCPIERIHYASLDSVHRECGTPIRIEAFQVRRAPIGSCPRVRLCRSWRPRGTPRYGLRGDPNSSSPLRAHHSAKPCCAHGMPRLNLSGQG